MFKVRGGVPVSTGEHGGKPGQSAGKGYLGSEDKAFTVATSPDQWLAQQAIPIDDGRAIEKHQNGLGVGKPGDPAYTLDTIGAQSVAYPINTMVLGGRPDPVNDARMTMGIGNDGDPQFTLQANHSHAVATPMAVRRLTPIETERLQGFPDNWTQIPWRGKPAEDCPDGPRYKACGNSMAVPVMRWIGERIAAVEASPHA